MVGLFEVGLFLAVHSRISNLDFLGRTTDYFGRLFPGAWVEVWLGGVNVGEGMRAVSLSKVTRGDYAIHVYVRGKLCAEALYLGSRGTSISGWGVT